MTRERKKPLTVRLSRFIAAVMTDKRTATLSELIERLQELLATHGPDVDVYHEDDDTKWELEVDPARITFDPEEGGTIVLRTVGYAGQYGDPV